MSRSTNFTKAHDNEYIRNNIMELVERELQAEGASAVVAPCEDEEADEDVFSFIISTLKGSKRVTIEDVFEDGL